MGGPRLDEPSGALLHRRSTGTSSEASGPKRSARGAEPLYWEDVKIGDMPTGRWTVPSTSRVAPTAPYGMGTGGSRSLKNEIMDPAIFATMVRGEKDGIYRLPDREDCVPAVPDGAVPFFMVDPARRREPGPSTRRTSTRPAPTGRP